MNFSKILIATDLSPAAQAAFELAAYEEKMEGTKLIMLHVHRVSEPLLMEEMSYPDPALFAEYSAAYHDKALFKLKELTAKYFHGQDVRCEVIISSTATAADEICTFAANENCDLIVLGSRGHTVLGALFIGSVAQRVLLLAQCPVLVVPPSDRVSWMGQPGGVL